MKRQTGCFGSDSPVSHYFEQFYFLGLAPCVLVRWY